MNSEPTVTFNGVDGLETADRPTTAEENNTGNVPVIRSSRPSSRQLLRSGGSERDLLRRDSLARQNSLGQAIPPLLKLLSGQNSPRNTTGSPAIGSGATTPLSHRRLSSVSTNMRNVFEPDEIQFFNEMIKMRELKAANGNAVSNPVSSRRQTTMVQLAEDDSSQAMSDDTNDHHDDEDDLEAQLYALNVVADAEGGSLDGNWSEKFNIPGYSQLPRYLAPTMSSTLPPYLNGEVERVRNSYQTGNYNQLKKLPHRLEPGNVQLARRQHTVNNLITTHDHTFKPASKLRDVPFHPLVYVGTDYDKQKNLNKYIMDQEKVITESYSRKPFKFTRKIRLKYEDTFYDPDYKVPDMGPGQDIVELKTLTRSDATQSDKYIFGKFSTPKRIVSHGDSVTVKKWIKRLHEQLAIDWPEYAFRVKFTISNEFLIQFLKPSDDDDEEDEDGVNGGGNDGGMEEDGVYRGNNMIDFEAGGKYGFDEHLEDRNSSTTLPMGNSGKGNTSLPSKKVKKLRPIFPPPNNLLSKYMQRLATSGLAKEFKLLKRGDRWNVMEEEYAIMSDSLTSGSMGYDYDGESQGISTGGPDAGYPSGGVDDDANSITSLDANNQMQMMINMNEAIPLALSPKISSPKAAAETVARFSLVRPDGSPLGPSRSRTGSHNEDDPMATAYSSHRPHSQRSSPPQGVSRKSLNWYVPDEHGGHTNKQGHGTHGHGTHGHNQGSGGITRVGSVEEVSMIGIRKSALKSSASEPLTQHHHELQQHLAIVHAQHATDGTGSGNPSPYGLDTGRGSHGHGSHGHGSHGHGNRQGHSNKQQQHKSSVPPPQPIQHNASPNKHNVLLDESALQPQQSHHSPVSSKQTKSASQQKVLHYLTFAFYAPWITSSYLNTLKVTAAKNRQEAKKVMQEKSKQKKTFKLMKFDPKNPDKFTAFLRESEAPHPMAAFVTPGIAHDGNEEAAMDRIAEVGRQFSMAMGMGVNSHSQQQSTKHVTINIPDDNGNVVSSNKNGASSKAGPSIVANGASSGAHSASIVAASDAAMIAKRKMLVG